MLNDAAARKHIENRVPLSENEWQSGDNLWIISLIGKDIRPRKLFPALAANFTEQTVNYIRRDKNLQVKKVVEISRTSQGFRIVSRLLSQS